MSDVKSGVNQRPEMCWNQGVSEIWPEKVGLSEPLFYCNFNSSVHWGNGRVEAIALLFEGL